MSEKTQKKETNVFLARLIFSPMLLKSGRARKVAYVAISVALSVVCNMFFEFKLGMVQYSFTTAISALIGVFVGAGAGFLACFIGDAIGFIGNPFSAYAPWIGLSTGLIAFIAGVTIHFFKSEKVWTLYLKIAIISILTLLICSIGINTSFLWIAYYNEMSYSEYFIYRYIVMGQFLVSAVNYVLLFVLLPIIRRIPFFRKIEI